MAIKLAACILFLLLLTAGSLTIGHYPVPAGTALSILASKFVAVTPYWSPAMETVVCSIRLPRILAAVLIGAALSVSGAAYQGLFRNPLVSPDILGVSAGASCGAALAMLFNQSVAVIEAAAFVFALAAVGISYLISRIFGRQGTPVLLLILSGIIIGTLFNSFVSITKLVADPNNTLPAITFWLMGSLATISAADVTVIAGPILLGLASIYLLRWNLNVMAFGEEEARSMGVETQLLRLGVIACATLMTAAAVSVSGVIALVGLIVPHLARLLVGPNYRYLIPVSTLLGASFLLVVDDLSRMLSVTEIPTGIVTSILGAPLFLYLLFHTRKGWV
jgi:iron complex transport system permease protein